MARADDGVLSTPKRKLAVISGVSVAVTILVGGVAVWQLRGTVPANTFRLGALAVGGIALAQVAGGVAVHRAVVGPLSGTKRELEETKRELEETRREFEEFEEEMTSVVQEGCSIMGRCEQGDLTGRMPTDTSIPQLNKLAEDFNVMMDRTEAIVSAVAEFAEDVSMASKETARSLNEVQRATEETTEMTRTVSDDIESRLHTSVEKMEQFTREADEIGEVVEFISDVARQTNMLGLNARIEASKSAEGASGFKTVASQVKELADETQDAANDIESLLNGLREQADVTLDDIEATEEEVDRGTEQIRVALETLVSEDGVDASDVDGVADLDEEVGLEAGISIPDARREAESLADTADDLARAVDMFEVSDDIDYSVLDLESGAGQSAAAD